MRNESLEAFGATIEKTGLWLDELIGETGWSTQRAYSILRAVLHVLRDRLSVEEAADLGAQLPMLVRGLYYEGWRPAAHPLKYRHKEDFLQRVGERCTNLENENRETAVRAVFKILGRHVAGGEIEQVRNQLPDDVRALWTTTL